MASLAIKTSYSPGPIIVGAGPSGLATAACLAEAGIPAIVLEKSNCVASLWRHWAYDRLTLHIPKQFCELPLMGFPKDYPKYPSKDKFISYIDSYAAAFNIQPRFSCAVEEAEFDQLVGVWRVKTREKVFESRWLVVATGENAEPVVPEFPGLENFSGEVIHSSEYRSGKAFEKKKVLVVGIGNSGMEICLDLFHHHAIPFVVVRSNVHVLPKEIMGWSTFGIAMGLLKWLPVRLADMILVSLAKLVLGDTERVGLQRPNAGPLQLKNLTGKTPVMDVGALNLIKSGQLKVTKEVRKVKGGEVEFVDGKAEQFDCIIFATGYRSNVPSWLKGGGGHFTEEGKPKMRLTEAWKGENGLYCVGFNGKGLLGATFDARNVSWDLRCQWAVKPIDP